jgi:hypothetical protein
LNHTKSIFVAFSLLVGILVFAIWSNTHAFAQQLPSSSLPPSGGGSSSSPSNPISPELKAKMCDPSNPSLKVVNTTESNICGIPKTVKPPVASSTATPPTSAVSSSSSPSTQQTATTKSTTVATNLTTSPKQQQVKTSNNNTNALSRPTGTMIAPVSQPTTTSTSNASSASPSAIAPQIKAVNQQRQPLIRGINSTTGTNSTTAATIISIIPINGTTIPINSTAGQNDAFLAAPPVAASGKLMYLGYHGGDSTPTSGDSGPNDSKQPSIHRSSSTASDGDSTGKKKTSSTKIDRADSANKDSSPKKDKSSSSRSSGSTNDGSESSSSDLASAIKNKVDSSIRNSLGEVRHSIFGFSDYGS